MLKTIAALVLLSALPERDVRPELEVKGRVKEISVSPRGDLWIGTATGFVYRSDDGGRTWAEAAVPLQRMEPPETWISDHADRVTFFDERRAILSGSIGENRDRVLVTDDGGATWTPAVFDAERAGVWVYDAQATPDGHAWLVGSDGSVRRSDDFGHTWRKLSRPFGHTARTMSVSFATPERGVVGTLTSGELAMTTDGGGTWSPFTAAGAEMIAKGCPSERDKRVEKVRLLEDRVIVEQCGGVFAAPLAEPRVWTRVTAGGEPLVKFDVRGDGSLIGVTAGRDVVGISPDGQAKTLTRVERLPMSVSASGARVAMLDPTMKITRFDGEQWLSSRMFGKGVATSWPVVDLDRGKDDVLWGVSGFYLYRSDDRAKTWERVTELPAEAAGVAIQQDGNVLIWDGHGWVQRWLTAEKRFADVANLSGLDVAGSFRRRDLWLLYGGRQYDTAGRVEVAQTFSAGQFAGSVDYGFVAASRDGGTTWSVIDRWDEGPQHAFLADDGTLTLVSWLCGIRQGKVTLEPLAAKMTTVLKGSDRKKAPYAQRVYILDLLDPKRGSLVGWIHHIDTVAYETRDGGRSWKPRDIRENERMMLLRLFDGRWIAVVPPATLQVWNGKTFEKLTTLSGGLVALWVDSRGELTARFDDGSVRTVVTAR